MRVDSRHQSLTEVLRDTRKYLALANNDFAWSSWEDASAALQEIDGIIARLDSGSLPPLSSLRVLFLPTGPIQEVSLSSGWGQEFLRLADRFDAAAASTYGSGVLSRLRRWVSL